REVTRGRASAHRCDRPGAAADGGVTVAAAGAGGGDGGGDDGLVVETEVPVVDLQRQRGQGGAVDPAPLGAVGAVVGVPAPGGGGPGGGGGGGAGGGPGVPGGPRRGGGAGTWRGCRNTNNTGCTCRTGGRAPAGSRPPRCWPGRARRRRGTGGRPTPRRSSS